MTRVGFMRLYKIKISLYLNDSNSFYKTRKSFKRDNLFNEIVIQFTSCVFFFLITEAHLGLEHICIGIIARDKESVIMEDSLPCQF